MYGCWILINWYEIRAHVIGFEMFNKRVYMGGWGAFRYVPYPVDNAPACRARVPTFRYSESRGPPSISI